MNERIDGWMDKLMTIQWLKDYSVIKVPVPQPQGTKFGSQCPHRKPESSIALGRQL